jgi:thiosulfate/3-mercaptopyruvate sulfurtransferase
VNCCTCPARPRKGRCAAATSKGPSTCPGARRYEDGTFKTADDLRELYEKEQGLSPDKNVIAYCRIGERSSHTWFVLHYLLGYPNVRNYDGSWTEWGNLVGVPIENPSKGEAK